MPEAPTTPAPVTWSAGIPCPQCGGPTLAATPGRPEEAGDYCEACARAWDPAAVAAMADAGLTPEEAAAELAESAEEMAADDAAGRAMLAADAHDEAMARRAVELIRGAAAIDALRTVGARLADIRTELQEIADAIGPDTFAGGAAARAFHALAPLRLATSAGYAATCPECGAHDEHEGHGPACPFSLTPHQTGCPHA